METTSANYVAVITAAVAAFAFGAVWYGTLSKPWMKAARVDPSKGQMSVAPFVTSFVAELVMAWVMSGVIIHAGAVTIANGLLTGALLWLGFMATTMAVNHRYEGFGWDLTLIDGGHWLGVALIMGAVIGAFG